jgi:CelD/BcsL family acetyltransferase involved in cellulose biosynthesis
MMRLLLAERRGRLLAGSVFLMFGSTVFYAFNGRLPESLALRPNDLIQWHAIRDAAAQGYQRYDFGEVEPDQAGLGDFKAKWGAAPATLMRYVDPPSTPSQGPPFTRPIRRRAEAVWHHVPLAVTARVGDVVYRRL